MIQCLASLKNIWYEVEGKTILEDVSFSINSGQHISILGPNGAGKSTLIRILLKSIQPNRGEVFHHPELKIGYVPQRMQFNTSIPMTVEWFLRHASSDALLLLDTVGLSKHYFSRSIHELSGGELQRILLARALAANPQLLVLDEPTQGVDADGEIKLYALIHRLTKEKNMAVVMISHDLHFVMKQTDHVICLNQHVCCEGVPESVRVHPDYLALFGSEGAKYLAWYQHHHDHEH